MIDIKKLNEAIGSSGWMLEGTEIDTNGINSKLTIRLYGNRMQIEQPAIGVISSFNKWDRALTEKEISDLFSGKVRPEDIPQESPKVKEIGVGIPEAARNILMAWQRSGLKFFILGDPVNFPLKFDCTMKGNYTIPEQPIPEGVTVETVEAMWRQGLMLEFDGNFGWHLAADGFNWNGIYRGAQLLARLRIPAQPIPEKLLEVPQDDQFAPTSEDGHDCEGFPGGCNRFGCPGGDKCYMLNNQTPHAAERALWKAQREAGTNEIWQKKPKIGGIDWADIRHDLMFEPGWDPDWDYQVKPMKLTAKIISGGVCKIPYYWEFAGTREEYRAECEKYGYVVVSEIKEVKLKTVKYYFALIRNKFGAVDSLAASSMISFNRIAEKNSYIIIGDIEEREVDA